jgi:hypothetical protein
MMRALLDEFSIVQDQHAIRLGWQQQTVRDSNHRPRETSAIASLTRRSEGDRTVPLKCGFYVGIATAWLFTHGLGRRRQRRRGTMNLPDLTREASLTSIGWRFPDAVRTGIRGS